MQQLDGTVEQKNVFSHRSRFGMFLLLSSIAGSAIIFGAKEQQAEDKVHTSSQPYLSPDHELLQA
jgi:hypothetical protein